MTNEQQSSIQNTGTLRDWLSSLSFGQPMTYKAVTLIPLHTNRTPKPLPYRVLSEAITVDEVVVTEQPHASVPTLQLINKGAFPVLILDGEEVQGGNQNRVVNTTLLIPAHTTFDLPVTCVEHGRWHETAPQFMPGEAAYPSLRGQKAAQVNRTYMMHGEPVADQGAIWDEVADRQYRLGSVSRTGAMRDTYAQWHENLKQAQEQLNCPEDDAVGVLVLIGGQAACADIFDKPQTLKTYWPRLVHSYALEAIDITPVALSVDAAHQLLQQALAADYHIFPSPGLGQDVRISGNSIVGASLIYEEVAIHTAMFRSQDNDTSSSAIHRPSQRARRFQHQADRQQTT